MKKLIPFALFTVLAVISSCEKDQKENYEIKGFAQKGPYNEGTSITVIELKDGLQPTGLNYYSTVSDKMGNFLVPDVGLTSNYVELMADGYYFHENFGADTYEKLLLKAVADVSENSDININILTHISVDRIKYLVQNEGKAFQEAKEQAQDEILKIFNLAGNETDNYERLDISKGGELNSKLLAISSIIQGGKTIPELTRFLTNFSTDIATDGVVDSKEIQTNLATSAVLCNVGGIRTNLTDFYDNDSVFNSFQNYVKHFVDTTEFESLIDLNFPKATMEGENLLALQDNIKIDTAAKYCLSQNLDVSKFDNFMVYFIILKISGTGNIIYTTNDLTGWSYDTNYCSPEPSGDYCGIDINSYLLNSASKTPLTLKFHGSGEIRLSMIISSPSLRDNRIEKYLKW